MYDTITLIEVIPVATMIVRRIPSLKSFAGMNLSCIHLVATPELYTILPRMARGLIAQFQNKHVNVCNILKKKTGLFLAWHGSLALYGGEW